MTNRNRVFWATTALMTSLAMTSAVHAQETTGGVIGVVYDASGAPVSGASVTVTHLPSGTTSNTVTNADGAFSARNLRVGGPYVVQATSSAGTSSANIGSIGIGSPSSIDLTLTGAADDAATDLGDIVVTGSRNAPVPGQAQVGQGQIETLPSISRDIKDFVRTTPFATVDPSNNNALSIGGQNTRFNAFLVDGVRQGDDFGLNGNGYPTVNSPISISVLEAVSVDVAPYDVQYGSFTGGVVNSVTKSGGNTFQGEAFYEQTGENLQGNTFSYDDFVTGATRNVNVAAEFDEKTYGATLSGPILRDRLFFLVNYEKFEGTQPVLTGPQGSGSVNEVQGITQAEIDQVRGIVNTVYGYDPLDWRADELTVEDEKYFAKLDWNINDRHRAVFSYQQTEGSSLSLNGSSTSTTFPSIGLLSSAYQFEQNIKVYKAQLFSDWTDTLSTELSFSRKEAENITSNLAGSDFAAFQVYLDNPSGSGARRSIRLGPERSRHANELTNDLDQFRFAANYDAGFGHRITAGYERETVDVFNVFVQFANAEYEFASIAALQARQASFIGYQNAATNNKADGAAQFSYSTNGLFLQDEWDVNDQLTINAGFRMDWYETDDQPLNNPAVLATYGVPNNGTIDGKSVIQPRLGFNWRPDDTMTVYGGIGRFQGGSPNVWISNNYTNTGNLLGTFICRINSTYTSNFTSNSVRVCNAAEQAALQNVDGFNVNGVAQAGVTASANAGTGTVNLIDPTFQPSSIWKASLGVNKEFDLSRWGMGEGWNVNAEYVHSEIDNAVGWVDLNLARNQTGTAPDGRPTFTPINSNQVVLMLTNFEGGSSDQFALGVSKFWNEGWAEGLGFSLSHTYLDSTEQHAGTSSVALSNFQNLAVYDPNNPMVADSNYEISHATKLNLSYDRAFFGDYRTRINLFGQRRSGLNYSYVFGTNASNLVGEIASTQRQLLYVPAVDSAGLVTATSDPIARYAANFNFAGFNDFLQRTGLIQYAGQIAPRNGFKSPEVTTFDLHLEQEVPAFFPGSARLSIYADVENIGNLLNDEWGILQQAGFPFLSSDVVGINCQRAPVAPGTGATQCAGGRANAYEYKSFTDRSATAFNSASVWQVKFGVRYKF